MSVTSNPIINAQLIPATGLTGVNPIRLLICGQIGSGGTATTLIPYQDVQNMTAAQITGLFGTKSELTGRIMRALNILNGLVSVWVIGITAAAGQAAAFVQAITGTATAAGVMTLKIIDSELYTISISIAVGDTNTVVATAIMNALAAYAALPCTPVNSPAGTITYTANDVGTLGNKYTIEVDNIPAGLVVPAGQFTSGATDPTLTNMLTNVSVTRFHSISWPWQTAYSVVKAFLESRNVISNSFLQGLCYIGYDDTEANIHTALNGVSPVNSSVLVFMGNRQLAGLSYIITPPDWRCVEFMAIEALRLTQGAPIGRFLTVSSPLDQFGGPALASLALYNTPLSNTNAANPVNLFSALEQATALEDGFSVIGVNESSSEAITGPVVTTYKYNALGNADPSFKYVEYIRTGYTALEYMFNTLKATYTQYRLSQGDVTPGRAETNLIGITNFFLSMFATLAGVDYTLCPTGKQSAKYFANNLSVTANYATGVITATGQLPIVTQLRQINISFQMSFTIS